MQFVLGLSLLLFLLAITMLGASYALRRPLPASYGAQPGDAYLYAVVGGVIGIVAWLLAILASTPLPGS